MNNNDIILLILYFSIGFFSWVFTDKSSYFLAWPIHLLISTYKGLKEHLYD